MTDTTPTADAVLRERFEWWWDRDAQAKSGHAHSERCGDKYATTHMSAEWGAFQAGHAFALATPAPQPDALDARTVRNAIQAVADKHLANGTLDFGDTLNGLLNFDDHDPNWVDQCLIELADALAALPQRKDDAGVDAIDRGARALIDISPTISGYHETHMELMRPKVRAVLAAVGAAPAAQGDAEPVYQVLAGDWQEVDRAFYEASPAQHRRILYAAAPRPASDDARDAGRLDAIFGNEWSVCRMALLGGGMSWMVYDKDGHVIAHSAPSFRAAIDAAIAHQPARPTTTVRQLTPAEEATYRTLSARGWSAAQDDRGWKVFDRNGEILGEGQTQVAAVADAVARRDVGGVE